MVSRMIKRFSSLVLDVALKEDQISVIREQYAKFKYDNKMNLEILDEYLGPKFKIFSQFNSEMRKKIYQIGTYCVRENKDISLDKI